jgi:hypothetical protein
VLVQVIKHHELHALDMYGRELPARQALTSLIAALFTVNGPTVCERDNIFAEATVAAAIEMCISNVLSEAERKAGVPEERAQ